MFHYIKLIEIDAENYSIDIIFDDGMRLRKSFTSKLSGYLAVLKDKELFKQVKIGNRGRSIIWERFDIDFCADALRDN